MSILLEEVREALQDSMLAPGSGRAVRSVALFLVAGGRQWLAPQYLRGAVLMPLQRQASLLFLSRSAACPSTCLLNKRFCQVSDTF